ncbi:MAG: bifunctional folylpolyglutamate synthase/dihydrofolate synthase [Bacillati bacterium ANGP1]|uniref:tetrahydrofolate synthase n=1 Tax=Candidatus Segetimicrobium genomatis TaxID=2569760 RepID=A0A537JD84_9BACT|nr:MAG: bifunctional folylpolyglutamate synthase/dihydrofolate synthase [Terrabacteria group bacterium ANGP1]
MTYAAALAFLDGLITADRPRPPYSEVKLARMRHLLGLIGDPHRRLKSVLVAGTKGKGSTAVMIAGMLRAQGLRTGLTVKPHLVEYRERIQINGQMISQADLAALVEILPWGPPTYVETTVALALLHFVRREVDLAVVEVGIGGRLDATNVLDPLVSVITPISYDHMEILGETLTEIASEKAGIIRPRGRVVSAPQPDEAAATIEQVCRVQQARLVQVGRDVEVRATASTLSGVQATVQGLRAIYPITVPLLGRHQAINAGTAIAAVEALADCGITVAPDAVRRGLAAVRCPARIELIDSRPHTVIDVGHNPASMAALRDTLRALLGGGMLATKDYRSVTALIAPMADVVVTTTPHNPHALSADALADEVRTYAPTVIAVPDRRQAVERAQALAAPEDVLVITGSFYLVGEAREWLRRRKAETPART